MRAPTKNQPNENKHDACKQMLCSTINGYRLKIRNALRARCLRVSVYLFIIRGCSTFDYELSCMCICVSLFVYFFSVCYVVKRISRVVKKMENHRKGTASKKYVSCTPFGRQNGELAQSKKCIIYRITTKTSSAYFLVNCVENQPWISK